jgi:hypothetical protein
MTKTQIFRNTRLVPDALVEVDQYLTRRFVVPGVKTLQLCLPDEVLWTFDEFEQFMAEYPQSIKASYLCSNNKHDVLIQNIVDENGRSTYVEVRTMDRVIIDKVFGIVERYRAQSATVPPKARKRKKQQRELVN